MLGWIQTILIGLLQSLYGFTVSATAGAVTFTKRILVSDGSATAPAYSFSSQTGLGWYRSGTDVLSLANGTATPSIRMFAAGTIAIGTGQISWGSTANTSDLSLFRDAANALAQRMTTSPQIWRVYNTFTDLSNYERGVDQWATNVYQIGAEAAGTGTLRSVQLIGASVGLFVAPTTTSFVTFPAGTTAKSVFNLPAGAAPTSPVDGDVWREDNTNTGFKIRVNGITKTISLL